LWGLSLGERLGIVTSYETHVPLLNTMISQSGQHQRFVARNPVNSVNLTREEFMKVFENRAAIVQRVREKAELLVDEGAEVVIEGCVILGVLCAQEKLYEVSGGVQLVNPVGTGSRKIHRWTC